MWLYERLVRHWGNSWQRRRELQRQRDWRHGRRRLRGIELLEDRTLMAGLADPTAVVTTANIPLQPVGVPFVDAAFGATLRRVSNASDSGGFETQIYSQLQAFSSDNEYLLLTGSNGYIVRRVDDLSLVAGLNTDDWNVPRWHPTQPHVLIHFDTNADTDLTLQFTNVDTGVTTDVVTLPSQYQYIVGNQSFDEVSDDGRWVTGLATRNDGQRVIFSLDMISGSLGAVLPINNLYTSACQPDPQWGVIEPDWIAASPLGNYLVVQWPRDGISRCSGLETFNIQTGAFAGRVYDGHQHGDLGVLPDGATEYFMTFELAAPSPDNGRPALATRLLPGTATVSPPNFLTTLDWGNGEHISCRGPNGTCVVTAGSLADNGLNPFEGEIFLQRTDGSVLRLAHHRSTSSDYWVQPRASISRDGRYVVFASDWGRQTGGLGDPYIIDLGAIDPPPNDNAAPVLAGIGNKTVNFGDALTFTASASDADGDALTFSLDAGAPAGASIHPTTGVFTWTPAANQPPGTYSALVRVTDDGTPNLSDAEMITINVLSLPQLRIGDVTITEGDAGMFSAQFVVTLSAASNRRVTVQFATAAGSATPSSDFRNRTGTLTFKPGQTSKTISVPVVGDRRDEPNETFFVNLTNPTNSTIADGQGQGTIVDNDPPVALSISGDRRPSRAIVSIAPESVQRRRIGKS